MGGLPVNAEKILVVDDDLNICELLRLYLEKEGYTVVIANDGASAVTMFRDESPSLVLLDIMLPKLDGWQVCREIRKFSDKPIIMLTAKGEVFDRVLGLELGADDYISKPFVVEEFVARVKAHIRREKRISKADDEGIIKVGDIEIRKGSYEVFKNGKPVSCSTREFQLLEYLMENAGKVLTREQIFSHVWDTEFGDIGTVAVNIKSIRDKLDPSNEYIKTVWGVGYKFIKAH